MSGYATALAYLYGLQPRGVRLELERMRAATAMFGDPHQRLPCVHVAGTNGKGSVVAMLEHGMRAAGQKTGLYTSPHLHSFRERIQVDRVPISENDLVQLVDEVRTALSRPDAPILTFFEVAHLLAWLHFVRAKVDVVLLEVGLGGRFDATNIIDAPLLSVITSIGLDHTQYLGDTEASIAFEKAGIIKRGCPLVVGAVSPDARAVIEPVATEQDAPCVWVSDERFDESDGSVLEHRGANLRTRVPTFDDGQNTRTAMMAMMVLQQRGHFSSQAFGSDLGFERTSWIGRQEFVSASSSLPALLFDAAHNLDGCVRLAHSKAWREHSRVVLLFAVMADKNWKEMLDTLLPKVEVAVFPRVELDRALDPTALAQYALSLGKTAAVANGAADAIALLDEHQTRDAQTLWVVCGSIYFMAEARAELRARYRIAEGFDWDANALPHEAPIPM